MEASTTTSKDKNIFGTIRDVFGLLRDMIIFLIFLLLLLFPTQLNNILTNAGFEEGSLAGFKWKSGLAKSNQALRDAQTANQTLTSQLDSVTKVLNKVSTQVKDTMLRVDIARIEKRKAIVDSINSQTNQLVQQTISSNAQLVSDAQKQLNQGGLWGVVFSADLDLDKAAYEQKVIAKRLQIPNVSIFYRQGYYRSVSVVDTHEQAVAVLAKAKNRRSDSYIISMQTWCPSSNQNKGYLECSVQ